MRSVLRHLRRAALLPDGGGLTDGQLLERFLSRRDEAAFEAIVYRHGPMVLSVCRRVLRHQQDAEDAFQASFLVLARKAAAVSSRELLGNWLYGVAYRTALKARTMNARRRAREERASGRRMAEAPREEAWEELLPLLDEELSRLPDKYRVPVVLCDLEGRTRKEVAAQLKVPEGTLSGRLTTARRLLASRLARYGLALSGGAVAAALSEKAASACVTGALAASTARVAVLVAAGEALTAGAVPARVVALAEGVVKTMLLTKLRAFVAVAVVAFVGAGVVGLAYRTTAAEPGRAGGATQSAAAADDLEALRLEVEALRKSLQATRAEVRSLAAEVQALKAEAPRPQGPGGPQYGKTAPQEAPAGPGPSAQGTAGFPQYGKTAPQEAPDRADTKGQPGMPPRFTSPENAGLPQTPGALNRVERGAPDKRAADPLAEAEAALKKLKEHPDDKQATDALEKALQRLREGAKPQGQTGFPGGAK